MFIAVPGAAVLKLATPNAVGIYRRAVESEMRKLRVKLCDI